MKSRGLAVVAAIVLIALAVFIRSLLVDDDGNGGGPNKAEGGSAPVVACTPELVAVCDALADAGDITPYTEPDEKGREQPAELELDEAAAPDAEIDGWITWDPAPEIANFDAGQTPIWDAAQALGSAPLAALAGSEVFGGLRSSCGETVDWACFAERGPEWGLTVGVGDPSTAEGLVRLAPFALAFAPDLDTEALESSDLRAIIDSSTISQADAATMSRKATQPGQISIVVGPEALLASRADSPQGESLGLEMRVLDPELSATVVIAPRTGRDVGDLAGACEDDAVAEALQSVGVDPCSDDRDDVDRAGFLYKVREKAS